MSKDRVFEIVSRLVEIDQVLKANKALYEEQDDLVQELQEFADVEQVLTAGNEFVVLVDNFADANIVYRPAAVKRIEAKVLTAEELKKHTKKASKKVA